MMKSLISFSVVFTLLIALTSLSRQDFTTVSADSRVEDLLVELGEKPQPHQAIENLKGVSVSEGKRLVLEGIAYNLSGKKSKRQSAHFVCTSCHNTEIDSPDLSVSNAQDRLDYSVKNGLPMVQGSTLYGIVNRSRFYNGDYDRKYGDLVKVARNDLRESIKLCAVECAQGRTLAPWELESILAYLWTIDLKAKDLKLSQEEMTFVQNAINKKENVTEAVNLIRSKYQSGVPATFVKPPEDRKKGYPVAEGNPKNGKVIYEKSCLHCHENTRFSQFNLDNGKLSFDYLEKHFPLYTRYSTYQVARYGTSPIPGKKAYMPLYTEEKMTNQMMEDLRAYVRSESK